MRQSRTGQKLIVSTTHTTKPSDVGSSTILLLVAFKCDGVTPQLPAPQSWTTHKFSLSALAMITDQELLDGVKAAISSVAFHWVVPHCCGCFVFLFFFPRTNGNIVYPLVSLSTELHHILCGAFHQGRGEVSCSTTTFL